MPVLKVKNNGIWEEIAGASQHVHTTGDITDFPTFITDIEQLQTKVGDTPVSSQINNAISNAIPSVTAADNGKFMTVVNGAWTAEAIPSAEGASF